MTIPDMCEFDPIPEWWFIMTTRNGQDSDLYICVTHPTPQLPPSDIKRFILSWYTHNCKLRIFFKSTICTTISLQPTVWILRFNELRNFNYIYPPWSQSVPMLFILVVPPETLYMFFLPLLLLTVTYIFIHEQIKFLLVIIIFIDNILLNFSNT